MKAIILKDFGSADQLQIRDIAVPQLHPGEVLVKTSFISINPIDVKTRKGLVMPDLLKKEDPMILGWDIAGTVTEVGSGVTGLKTGDEVFGMINCPGYGKAYAEFVAAKAEQLAIRPATVSPEESAAATIAAITAYQAITIHASVHQGQKVLIHAAAGGVGHYAVQIAKRFSNAYVIGTASAENRDFVLQLGADEHFDYKKDRFDELAPEFDYILDTIGGENIDRSLKILKPGGTIVALPSINSRDVGEKAAAQGKKGIHFAARSNGDDIRQIASFLEKDIIRSHISKVFSFDQMKQAHEQIESGKTVGKIVVQI